MKLIQSLLVTILLINANGTFASDKPALGYDLFGSDPEKVIVTHNWMGDSRTFDATRDWLDPHAFTYAFVDVRGYGASKGVSGKYTTEEIAADTLFVADHLGWEHFHLVGHSMNGMAGFKTVLRDWQSDRRIKSFVAITPVTPDGYPATDEDRAFLSVAIDDDETARNAFGGLTGGKLNDRWSQVLTEDLRATAEPEILRSYYSMWLDEDFSEEFAAAKIGTPVRVIGGRNDLPGFQEDNYANTVALWLSTIDFQYIENAGHYPMLETPVLFAKLVEEHLHTHK